MTFFFFLIVVHKNASYESPLELVYWDGCSEMNVFWIYYSNMTHTFIRNNQKEKKHVSSLYFEMLLHVFISYQTE